MTQIHQAVTRLITDACYKAKRHTRAKRKQHARPMTWRELRALPYQEYLQTEHWKRTRHKAIVSAGYICESCGNCAGGKPLQVHHLAYKRLGRVKPRDLRVLCGECHRKEHRK